MSLLAKMIEKSAPYVQRLTDQIVATVMNMIVHESAVSYSEYQDEKGKTRLKRDLEGTIKHDTLRFTLKAEDGNLFTVFTRRDKVEDFPPSGNVRGCKVFVTSIESDEKDKDGRNYINSTVTFSRDNAEFRIYHVN